MMIVYSISNVRYLAQGNVFLVRKKGGKDSGNLYAMKVIKKDYSRAEHLKREREVCNEKANAKIINNLYLILFPK